MPSFCIIDSCKRVKQIGDEVSFHKFPFNNNDLLKKWIDFVVKIGSPNERPSKRQKKITKFSTICCQHFAHDDFTINSLRRRCLKKNAVPSVEFGEMRTSHQQRRSGIFDTGEVVEIIEESDQLPIVEIEDDPDPLNQNFCSLCKASSSKLEVIDDNLFGLIKKCLPLITINDSLDQICKHCVNILQTFSSFIDKVISTQGSSLTINLPEPEENFEFIRNIKTEPNTNYEDEQQDQEVDSQQHQKMPIIQIVDFNDPSKFLSNINQPTQQNKCKILEIVDIKPFIYGNQNHDLVQIPSEDFVDDDEIQIVPEKQLKVEVPDYNHNDEIEIDKKLPAVDATANDHNYFRFNENEIKIEYDDDEPEAPADILKICRVCKKNFGDVRRYLQHKLLHHPPSQRIIKKARINNRTEIRRQCKMAIEQRKITKVVQKCLRKPSKEFTCETCGKSFKGSKNLYQHRLSHSEINKYVCQQCDKTFKRAHGLRQHVKSIHNNDKAHQCPVCEHKYLLKSDMSRCRHRNLKRNPQLKKVDNSNDQIEPN